MRGSACAGPARFLGIPAPTTSCCGIFSMPPNCARWSMPCRPTGAAWSNICLGNFEARVLPVLPRLHRQPVHNDLNPHNIVVDAIQHQRISGIIDFGDLTLTARINDLAIAAAYQVADSDDPLGSCLRADRRLPCGGAAGSDRIRYPVHSHGDAHGHDRGDQQLAGAPSSREPRLYSAQQQRRLGAVAPGREAIPAEAKWQIQRACEEEQQICPRTRSSRHAT